MRPDEPDRWLNAERVRTPADGTSRFEHLAPGRAIVFVDGDKAYIQSRSGKDLTRYFPELRFAPGRWVLDGELVIRDPEGNLEFDALQSRIHPAESRINLLAKEIPASYMVFDLLAEGDETLLGAPLAKRRARLEAIAERAGLEMSSASVSALFTKQPSQLKLTTLLALCTALQCTPNDLFELDTTPSG